MKNFRAALILTTLLITFGLYAAHPAYADSSRHHGERNNRYERYDDNRDDYRGYRHDKKKYQESRTIYYVPSYHPRYDQIYYRPWYREEVAIPTFRIGAMLPHYVRCKEPPRSVVSVLPPVPRGALYVQVDRDIYLMSEKSREILDAIVMISATNR